MTFLLVRLSRFALALLLAASGMSARAADAHGLDGYWMVDLVATEENLTRLAPAEPLQAARHLIAVGAYWYPLSLDITGDEARFLDSPMRRVDKNTPALRFEGNNARTKQPITFTIVREGRDFLRVEMGVSAGIPSYFVWSRTSPDVQNPSKPAAKQRFEAWGPGLQRIYLRLIEMDRDMAGSIPDDDWEEVLPLAAGGELQVQRTTRYTWQYGFGDAGSGYSGGRSRKARHSLRFRDPETGKTIPWQAAPDVEVVPVLLDVVRGTPYLVLYARPTKAVAAAYGCTELPYVVLVHDPAASDGWRSIPVEQAPPEISRANIGIVEDKPLIGHMSPLAVRQSIDRLESRTRGYFQAQVPRTYADWRFLHKNSYRNQRRSDDCRPPRPLPAQAVLPAPHAVEPQVIETTDHEPALPLSQIAWTQLAFDRARAEACKPMFRFKDSEDPWLGKHFAQDATGQRPVPYDSVGNQFKNGITVLCDDGVWFISHLEQPGRVVISRFTATGVLRYRLSFANLASIGRFPGFINTASLHTTNGMITFDWLNAVHDAQAGQWLLRRKTMLRVPESSLPADAALDDASARP